MHFRSTLNSHNALASRHHHGRHDNHARLFHLICTCIHTDAQLMTLFGLDLLSFNLGFRRVHKVAEALVARSRGDIKDAPVCLSPCCNCIYLGLQLGHFLRSLELNGLYLGLQVLVLHIMWEDRMGHHHHQRRYQHPHHKRQCQEKSCEQPQG